MSQNSYNSTNNNSTFEIPLILNYRLKNKGIIQKFVKNTKQNCIIIGLNHKYENNTVVILTNNVKNWTKFQEEVKNSLNRKGVYEFHCFLPPRAMGYGSSGTPLAAKELDKLNPVEREVQNLTSGLDEF